MLLCISMLASALSSVFCQTGSGEPTSSVSINAQIRLIKETFSAELNIPTSTAHISLKELFEEQLGKEIKSILDKHLIDFAGVTVTVREFSKGSVIVKFNVQIEGSASTVQAISDIVKDIGRDGTMGSFAVDAIEDIDECVEATSSVCPEFAECSNTFGSFTCECLPQYYDPFGDGTVCVSPVSILCEPNRMKISVAKEYIMSLMIGEDSLRLQNESCGVMLDDRSNSFFAYDDLSSCGSTISTNRTHVTYENTLSNDPKNSDIIETGADISIPFSCSYPKNLTASLNFEGDVPTINISEVPGIGSFFVDFDIYQTDKFETKETKRRFRTTDSLYLQASVDTRDPSLVIVIDECWATPTDSLQDPKRYDIIRSGCPKSEAVEGSVEILSNGESNSAQFSVKVFTFIDESTTYIHCNLGICSSSDGSCRPKCSDSDVVRRKRETISFPLAVSSRKRRQAPNTVQEKIVGPFYRVIPDDFMTETDSRFWAVTVILITLILVLFIGICCLLARLRSMSKSSATTLKMRRLGEENPAFF